MPNRPPQFTTWTIGLSAIENQPTVFTFMATDPDGHPIQWSLGGEDAAVFRIGAASGVLTFKSAPNYEDARFEDDNLPAVERYYKVDVIAGDNFDPPASASVSVQVYVADVLEPPGKPMVTIAVPDTNGHKTLDVRWTVENTGPPATYELSYCARSPSGACDSKVSKLANLTDTRHPLTGLLPATSYLVSVQVFTDEGTAWSDEVTATTAAAPDSPPVLTGDPAPHIDENTTAVPGEYTASDPDGDPVRWLTLTGADASAFELSGSITDATHTLQFTTAPNFEQQHRYDVTLRVQSSPSSEGFDKLSRVGFGEGEGEANGPRTTEFPVQVTVTDANDEGTLSLSTLQPQVGEDLTATLTDEDGPLENPHWHWSYFHDRAVSGFNGPDLAEPSRTLSVRTVHLGSRLLARVSYTDRHGSQSAHSDTTAAVVGPPWPPQALTATPGDGQVVLRWTAPLRAGGSALVRYESWYRGEGGVLWSPVAGGALADSVLVGGLTNGQEYTLAVRAVNGYGAGIADSTQATPQAVHHAPVIAGPTRVPFAEHDPSGVATYTATDEDGDGIGWSLAGADAAWFVKVHGGVDHASW